MVLVMVKIECRLVADEESCVRFNNLVSGFVSYEMVRVWLSSSVWVRGAIEVIAGFTVCASGQWL